MYIASPSRKGSLEFFNISASHPPLQDRIRILRGMTGASYGNYEESYRKVYQGTKGIIPFSGLAGSGSSVIGIIRTGGDDYPEEIIRAREASNAVWKVRNYGTITCECGVRLRVPPSFKKDSITCPRCRRRHPVRLK
jgi:heat shock protein HtpX